MNYLTGILQMIACDVDFYDSESYQGDSMMPFLFFVGSVVGLLFLIVGAAKYFTARFQWNLFYDPRNQVESNEEKREREKKKGIVFMTIGVIMMIVFYVANM